MWFYPTTKSFLRGLDEYVYVDLYSITYYITCYRIEYFMSLKQSNKINNEHMNQLKILLSDFYDMCNIYIDDYFKNRYRFEILDKYSTFKECKENGIFCYLMNSDTNQHYNVGHHRIYDLNLKIK